MFSLLLLASALGLAHASTDEPTAAPGAVELPIAQQKKLFKRWGCDAKVASVGFVGSEVDNGFTVTGWQVAGCGEIFVQTMNDRRGVWTFGPDDRDLRKRAPFDLSCDPAAVSYTYLSSTTRGAAGCGGRLTYVSVDQQWIADVSQAQMISDPPQAEDARP